jgi:hypothetical protein
MFGVLKGGTLGFPVLSQIAMASGYKREKRPGARTIITNPTEQEVQRWFVASFCKDGFAQRRHQCVDAAMVVYGLRHDRARELYDLCLLECRGVMFDTLPSGAPIAPGRLIGTREAWTPD